MSQLSELADAPVEFDWADAMDATRHECDKDTPYNGMNARTFKHFVISVDVH